MRKPLTDVLSAPTNTGSVPVLPRRDNALWRSETQAASRSPSPSTVARRRRLAPRNTIGTGTKRARDVSSIWFTKAGMSVHRDRRQSTTQNRRFRLARCQGDRRSRRLSVSFRTQSLGTRHRSIQQAGVGGMDSVATYLRRHPGGRRGFCKLPFKRSRRVPTANQASQRRTGDVKDRAERSRSVPYRDAVSGPMIFNLKS
jgi:hypothetical protein